MTRAGIERARFLAFVSMTKAGATVEEAITFIDLMWPLKEAKAA